MKDIVKYPFLNKIEKIIKIKIYDACKPVKVYEAFDGNLLNIKVIVIEINQYQLKDISELLEDIWKK